MDSYNTKWNVCSASQPKVSKITLKRLIITLQHTFYGTDHGRKFRNDGVIGPLSKAMGKTTWAMKVIQRSHVDFIAVPMSRWPCYFPDGHINPTVNAIVSLKKMDFSWCWLWYGAMSICKKGALTVWCELQTVKVSDMQYHQLVHRWCYRFMLNMLLRYHSSRLYSFIHWRISSQCFNLIRCNPTKTLQVRNILG